MAGRLSVTEVKQQIVRAATEMNEDACMLLALAHIETGGTFNNMATNGSKYYGIYQMSNGYGGVTGNDRFNPYIATKGVIKAIRSNKADYLKNGIDWVDYYAYLSHQQGLYGSKTIAKAAQDNLTISQYSQKYKRPVDSILGNAKRKWNLNSNSKVSDFVKLWQEEFKTLAGECTQVCPSGMSGTDGCFYATGGEKITAAQGDLTNQKFEKNRNFFLR